MTSKKGGRDYLASPALRKKLTGLGGILAGPAMAGRWFTFQRRGTGDGVRRKGLNLEGLFVSCSDEYSFGSCHIHLRRTPAGEVVTLGSVSGGSCRRHRVIVKI